MPPEEKKNEKMVPEDLKSLIPGFLGLGAQIGTAIPGLRKQPRVSRAEGAVTAATTGAARAAAGAGGAGFGATRGLGVREAGRQAQQVLLSAAPSIIQAATEDEVRYQNDLQARNERLAQFGSGLGGSLATLGTGLATMVAPETPEEAAAAQGYAPTGYAGAQPIATPATPAAVAVDPNTGAQYPVTTGVPATAGMMTETPGAQVAQAPQAAPQAQAAPAASAAPPPQPAAAPLAQLPALGRETMINDVAREMGISPDMAAAHLDRFIDDPYANPAARLNPYRKY